MNKIKKNMKKKIFIAVAGALSIALIVEATLIVRNLMDVDTPNRELKAELSEHIEKDLNLFLENMMTKEEEVPVLQKMYASNLTSNIATLSSNTLTKQDPNLTDYSNQVNNTVTRAGSGLSEEQLQVITTGIEAICISDTYNIIAERGLASTTDLANLTVAFDSRIASLENSLKSQANDYSTQLNNIQNIVSNSTAVAQSTKLAECMADITKITNELRKLQGDGTQLEMIEKLKTDLTLVIRRLNELDDGSDEIKKQVEIAMETLSRSGLSEAEKNEVINLLTDVDNKLMDKILEQSNAVNKVAADLSDVVDDCDKQKQTLTETIATVESAQDTLNNLSTVVEDNQNTLSQSISDLDGIVASNKSSLEGTITDVRNTLTGQSEELQGYITTASTNYANYVAAVENAQTVAENAIDSALNGDSGALKSIDASKVAALNDISNTLGSTDDGTGVLGRLKVAELNAKNELTLSRDKYLNSIEAQGDLSKQSVETAQSDAIQAIDEKLSDAHTTIDEHTNDARDAKHDAQAAQKAAENAQKAAEDIQGAVESLKDEFLTGVYSTDAEGNPVLTFTGGITAGSSSGGGSQ